MSTAPRASSPARTRFHTAAYLRDIFDPDHDPYLMHRTDVVGVSDLLKAAVDAGVPVVMDTSSTSTVEPAHSGILADEDT